MQSLLWSESARLFASNLGVAANNAESQGFFQVADSVIEAAFSLPLRRLPRGGTDTLPPSARVKCEFCWAFSGYFLGVVSATIARTDVEGAKRAYMTVAPEVAAAGRVACGTSLATTAWIPSAGSCAAGATWSRSSPIPC
jgi:hypothetical protein